MTNKIEQIAQAIYEGRNGSGAMPWSRRDAAHKAPYLKDAQAALMAMREPTADMLYMGEGLCDFVMPDGFDNSREGRQKELGIGWRVMIDAALTTTATHSQ